MFRRASSMVKSIIKAHAPTVFGESGIGTGGHELNSRAILTLRRVNRQALNLRFSR